MEKFLKMHKAIERHIALLVGQLEILKDDELSDNVIDREIEIEIVEHEIQSLKKLWNDNRAKYRSGRY